MPLAECTCGRCAPRRLRESSSRDARRFRGLTTHVITVECHDPDGTLAKLLQAIKAAGDPGHMFNIIVDPDAPDGKGGQRFDWDGDGSDSIQSIKVSEVG